MAKIDRNSFEDARYLFEKLLPDKETRLTVIKFLETAISFANSLNSENWNLNLDIKGNFIRFNVGHEYCIEIKSKRILIICDRLTLKPKIIDKNIPVIFRGHIKKEKFNSSNIDEVPDCLAKTKNSIGCLIKTEDIQRKIGFFRESNQDFIKSAINTKQLPKMREAHSTGAIDYLVQILDKKIENKFTNNSIKAKIYSPNDIIWFKNVTNLTNGEAYLNITENPFIIHFPNKHKVNVLKPAIDELILIYQKVNKTPAFTHLVTPIDNELIEDNTRQNFKYGRRVRYIAKTEKETYIPVVSTLWKTINLAGITQGNACKLENVKGIINLDELLYDIWQHFQNSFTNIDRQSVITTSAIINEIETSNPNITVAEGELKLVSHLVRERNQKIIGEKKRDAIRNNILKCEVCSFSFIDTFNVEFIECHHISPISISGTRETTLADLALVCSNCHRMLHTKFDGQYLTINELKKKIEQQKKRTNTAAT